MEVKREKVLNVVFENRVLELELELELGMIWSDKIGGKDDFHEN